MRTIVMRIMGLLFLRLRLTDDTLMRTQITLFQAIGDDTQSRGRRRITQDNQTLSSLLERIALVDDEAVNQLLN